MYVNAFVISLCGYCGNAECQGNIENSEYITSANIRSFEGCTMIQGAIKIFQSTLSGYVTSCHCSVVSFCLVSANADTAAATADGDVGNHNMGKSVVKSQGNVGEYHRACEVVTICHQR